MILSAEDSWLILFFVALMGLIWGSFFNVLILRVPGGLSLIPRSRCAKCLSPIPWYLNFPVFSYLYLRGRCQNCRASISIQYPLIEVFTCVLFVWAYLRFGLTWQLLSNLVFLSLLLIISVIDIYHRIIPDELSLPGIVLGFLATLLVGDMAWWESALGILVGGGLFFSIAIFYEKLAHREGLGGGDVKLLAMIGAWLGLKSILIVVVLSSLFGSILGLGVMFVQRRDLKTSIPFGPFLAAGAVIELFWHAQIAAFMFPGY